MKIKQEASGWPPECDTDEKKRNYLKEYKEHEGIKLEVSRSTTEDKKSFISTA